MSLSEKIYQNSPVALQNVLISAFGYQWKKRRFGGIFPEEYKAAKDRESYTADDWINYQQKHLQHILTHAFNNVPYYRSSLEQKSLTASDLQKITLQSLGKLPILSKDDLRKFGTTKLVSAVKEKNGSFLSTSGSTGTPVKILYSHAMHQRWFGIYEARIRNWAGVSSFIPRGMIGGRRIIADASNTPPFYRYNYFEKQAYFSAYHISSGNAWNYLEGIRKHKVEYMTGYAMSNYFLARFFKENNLSAPELKTVIPSSEKLTPEMRQLFKEVYNCKTSDSWGSVEACGIVSECEHGKLHISPDASIIEILDEDLQPVEDGVAGDVYCTSLINFDQPLIRYKIGDRMIRSSEHCACGRNMPVIREIVGRTEDVVIGKDGREMVRFHSVFYDLEKIKKAQVIQEDVEKITIKIEAEMSLNKEEEDLIRQRVVSQLGDINILIEEVASIPLNRNGKFQAVISKVKRPTAEKIL
ncbi:MAG: phenylacetate--CoA ligase family protein [Segetibacter sp.]|nr:phenylacetate--CoA ligase family protein [Segetibacter sp.]